MQIGHISFQVVSIYIPTVLKSPFAHYSFDIRKHLVRQTELYVYEPHTSHHQHKHQTS